MNTSTNLTGQPWCGWTPRRWQADALPAALAAIDAGTRGVVRACTGAGKSLIQAELVAQLVGRLERPEQRVVVTVPTQDLTRQLGATLERRLPGQVGRYYQHAKQLARPVIVTCHASLGTSRVECPECSGRQVGPHVRELDGEERAMAREIWEMGEAMGVTVGEGCAHPDRHTRVVEVLGSRKLTHALKSTGLEVAFWMGDECHQSNTDAFGVFTRWCEPEARLGFTATPWRSSERETLEHFDELVYDYGPSAAIQDGVIMMPTVVPYTGTLEDLDSEVVDAVCVHMIRKLLADAPGPGVVNAVSCAGADSYASVLCGEGIRAAAIHSKIDREAQAKRLEELRTGELDCLVHVNMLSEGVDLPWLEWLCMRRPTVTRVRFVQEVGRIVRVHPRKTRAVVLDPLDHFGSLSLDYEAMLGGEDDSSAVDELADEIARLLADSAPSEPGASRGKRPARAKALGEVRAWVRQQAFQARCLGTASLSVKTTKWRAESASSGQLAALRDLCKSPEFAPIAGEALTEAQLTVMRAAYSTAQAGEWTRGDTWDLLTIVHELLAAGALPSTQGVTHAA